MTSELWQRLKPLYSAALDLPEESRTGYIEQMSGGDPDLARELRALLAADKNAANTLDPPFADFSLFLPSKPVILQPGIMLAKRFRIVRHLGSGGMGDVYEALDLQLEKGHIALKTLRPEIAHNPEALARFKDEVLLARKITGPNICRIYELYIPGPDHAEHATAFLTMELLEGMTLHDHIEKDSPLSIADIRRIAEQLCAALCCIHEAGITHRDLKPRNVMLVGDRGTERAVVMDFGLALASGPVSGLSGSGFAAPAMLAGTPSYMAPEQFEGNEAGPATDIYALGLILYEMATGIQPFAAHTPLAAAIRRSKRPTFASTVRAELPPVWDDIITRCLEYDPALRFQSASEVHRAIKHPGKVIVRLGPTRRFAVPRVTLISAGIALLITLCAASWFFVQNAQQRKLSPDAARWYAMGMTALREGSYLKAIHLLNEVTRRDPTYAVAHAALADAWTELDFTESAQREMLLASAPDEQRGLSSVQRRYIDAVRTTLIRDYSAATQDYEAILKKDPADQKADGYVDLGRIYEKAGKVPETVAAYEKAAQLNPDDPAPFLHLGILKARLRQSDAAAEAFDRAESLYGAESDLEGLAEVAYQRGYAANDTANSAKAIEYLEKALAIARQIHSPQMEVRSLSQLSSVASNDSKDDEAIAYANQVISLARANGLEYWVTDGQVRLANAWLDNVDDYPAADQAAEEALHNAQANGHPRLEAHAALTLASLRYQQKRWDEDLQYARQALPYFQDYGFLGSADSALILITRAQVKKGDLDEALISANKLLEVAKKSPSKQSVMFAEELLGDTLQELSRYPEALVHFNEALAAAQAVGSDVPYEQLHVGDVLWQLGRYGEAEATFTQINGEGRKPSGIAFEVAAAQAEIRLSQNDPRGALQIAEAAQRVYPQLGSGHWGLNETTVLADLQLGKKDAALQAAAELLARTRQSAGLFEMANGTWLQSKVELQTGDPASARKDAEESERFFAHKGISESDALSLLTIAQAAQAMKDQAAADAYSRRSVQLFHQMAQSWGRAAFSQYLARPDRQEAFRSLGKLRGGNEDVANEVLH